MPPKRRKKGRRARFVSITRRAKSVPAGNSVEIGQSGVAVLQQMQPPLKLTRPSKEPFRSPKMQVINTKPKTIVEGREGEAVFERDNHGAFLSQSLNDLRKTNTMCDVMLRLPISGRILPAHRLILRARSPFFRTVFENQVHRNCKNLVVSLPNYVRPAGVEPILEYIYTGLLKVSLSTVTEIFQVAWLFKMEDVLAMCRQYCKTQKINPLQVNVMGDHCFLRRDVPNDNPADKAPEIKKVMTPIKPIPSVTTANLVPSLGNLKTIFPFSNLVSTAQNVTSVSANSTVNTVLKVLTTTTATTTTTPIFSKQVQALSTAQPVQVMPSSPLAISNLPKQLTSLVGNNNSVVVLSAGDVMYGAGDKSSPPIPKAVLEQLQALSKNSGGNKQRVFIVKTNSPRSLIKPTSPEVVNYKPASNDFVTIDGPPEVIECTPSLPENDDEDTDSAEDCNEDESPMPDEIDEQSEFPELKISNVTSVNDDDDVAPKFFPPADDDKTGSDNSCEAILPSSPKSPRRAEEITLTDDDLSAKVHNNGEVPVSNDSDSSGGTSSLKRTKNCEGVLSEESNSSDNGSICKRPKTCEVALSKQTKGFEGILSGKESKINETVISGEPRNSQVCAAPIVTNNCEAVLSEASNKSDKDGSSKSSYQPEITDLSDKDSSNHADDVETVLPDLRPSGLSATTNDCKDKSDSESVLPNSCVKGRGESGEKFTDCSSSEVEEPAVIIFRPKKECNATVMSDDVSSKIIVKVDADKQDLHPVIHVLNATHRHREILMSHGFYHVQVRANNKCQNVVVTADSDVQSLSVGNLNYVFPVEHCVEDGDLERFANIASDTGRGWTTVGKLILKPSADELDASVKGDCKDTNSEEMVIDSGETCELRTNSETEDLVESDTLLCSMCNCSFNSLSAKSYHIVKHHKDSLRRDKDGVNNFVCEVCQYKCPSLRRMYFHRFYQHHTNLPNGVAQFRCGLCPSIEYSFIMLKNHYFRYHKGIKSFECEDCGFKSKLMSTLQAHTKLVHVKFPTRPTLQTSLEVPTVTRNGPYFHCDFCGKKCKGRSGFENHRRTHTGEKPFKCTHCPYASAAQCNLKSHLLRVHNQLLSKQIFTGQKEQCDS